MNCKFYAETARRGWCSNVDCLLENCYLSDCFNECECFKPIICGKETTNDSLHLAEGTKIELPKYSARISIGNFQINLTDKTFTEEQIKNMKEMLGWEVENL